jgi:L-ribulokinase
MREFYSLGIDFGTSSVRALIVHTATGQEVGTAVAPYASGRDGILLDAARPDLARQNPQDYVDSMVACVQGAIKDAQSIGHGGGRQGGGQAGGAEGVRDAQSGAQDVQSGGYEARKDQSATRSSWEVPNSAFGAQTDARQVSGSAAFDPANIIGIGIDTTGSTPIPVDSMGVPLAFDPRFSNRLAAMVWLWKDHTAHSEAARITAEARVAESGATEVKAPPSTAPNYLAKCGGVYSSEWFWAKIWHCLTEDPEVFAAAYTWVEHADWIPALLTGTDHPSRLKRGICAAGHKALFHTDWGGYPEAQFLNRLDPVLIRLRETLPDKAYSIGDAAGDLTEQWAALLGLKAGIKVAIGAFDAHLGGVGSGVEPGTLVKIIGTSTCDIMTAPLSANLPDIPGLCGIVPESVLPGSYGLEAGQSGVGDIFNWFVDVVRPEGVTHDSLTAEAEKQKPGQSGLLALDWLSGNRTVLVDQRLSGLILGMNTHSTPAHIYRALIEATAFGARTIIDRFEAYGIEVKRVVNCGGITAKNKLLLQIYADVLNRPMFISGSNQTCAVGAAIAGAVVAGAEAGGHSDFPQAMRAMTCVLPEHFKPIPANVATYNVLFEVYSQLHDAFGVAGTQSNLSEVMKTLLNLRDEVNQTA